VRRDDLKALQAPLKERYVTAPDVAFVTLSAAGNLAEGDLDFRGTLGVDPEAPVGFSAIRLSFELDADAEEKRRWARPRISQIVICE
jgi:hypothetical protein